LQTPFLRVGIEAGRKRLGLGNPGVCQPGA